MSAATDFLARTSGLNAAYTSAYTTMIDGLVSDGVWSLLDALYMLWSQDSTTALLNLCSASFPLVVHGSPTFAASAGYTGVTGSSTVYLDTQYVPATAAGVFTQNSAHISVYVNTPNGLLGQSAMGTYGDNNSGLFIAPRYSGDSNNYVGLNDAGNGASTPSSNSDGFWVVSRSDASTLTQYRNASSFPAPNTTSLGPASTYSIVLLARGFGGGSIAQGSGFQMSAASIGAALTSGQVTSFYNRINQYFTDSVAVVDTLIGAIMI